MNRQETPNDPPHDLNDRDNNPNNKHEKKLNGGDCGPAEKTYISGSTSSSSPHPNSPNNSGLNYDDSLLSLPPTPLSSLPSSPSSVDNTNVHGETCVMGGVSRSHEDGSSISTVTTGRQDVSLELNQISRARTPTLSTGLRSSRNFLPNPRSGPIPVTGTGRSRKTFKTCSKNRILKPPVHVKNPIPPPLNTRLLSSHEPGARLGERCVYSESSCPICLDEFRRSSYVTFLPCYHVFHYTCLANWLQRKSECPVCRTVYQPPFRTKPKQI